MKSENENKSINITSHRDIRIVIMQRGWCLVGEWERQENECVLTNASVIRVWGTERGLGQIAKDGPTQKTKLDKCFGQVEFNYLTIIATIRCEAAKWENNI